MRSFKTMFDAFTPRQRIQRKLTREEWAKIEALGPGVRDYQGKKTFFYNGEILWDRNSMQPIVHGWKERHSWEVIIVIPGVEVIPWNTFDGCKKLKTVIMSDSVRRIERGAFERCKSLKFVNLSRNLEYIGRSAFWGCESLVSIFIPPTCREIGFGAFEGAELLIFHIPQHIELEENVISQTALLDASPFEEEYYNDNHDEVHEWLKNINFHEDRTLHQKLALHRACSSFQPLTDIVYGIVREQGIKAMSIPNEIGITPSQYLHANPYADIDEQKILKMYILDMMGELV